MTPSHLPTAAQLDRWPAFTSDDPMPLLVSACIAGIACGSDATSYGAPYPQTAQLLALPNVRAVQFCPEDFAFGTPREIPDIHGGDGFDVLDGKASVRSASGADWTDEMLGAARAMLDVAKREAVRLALLMDISAACGSQVIYRGARSEGVYQNAVGVGAALLIRNGIPVVSQRDDATLGRIVRKLDPTAPTDPAARYHHESDWYIGHFSS